MRERVPIRRTFGIQGLFWSLLIEALEEGVTFKSCKRCGKAIQGRKTRAYCGKIENPECFRERRASDRRRARANAGEQENCGAEEIGPVIVPLLRSVLDGDRPMPAPTLA